MNKKIKEIIRVIGWLLVISIISAWIKSLTGTNILLIFMLIFLYNKFLKQYE